MITSLLLSILLFMLKKAFLFLLLLMIPFLVFAEDEDYFFTSDIPVTYGDTLFRERILERTGGDRDPIGLVLTGGSARALAHLGVLSYLEENGIVPDFIISNSMGSIIALLYAAGLEPAQIAEFLKIGDLSNYFSLTLPLYGGLLDASGFRSLVDAVVGPDLRIEDLEIPVMVICDDLVTKREIRIAEGDFTDVLIASFALPVYFPPCEYNGHLLLDGGVKSLAPISDAYEYSDTVIISTTFYDLDTINLRNPITVLNSAFDVGKRQRAASDMKEHSGYIWIRCAVEQFSFMDFASAFEMMAIGYESAKEQADALEGIYKSGSDGFSALRASYEENIAKVRKDLYYFDRVESKDVSNVLSLGYKGYDADDSYLNEALALGLKYKLRYRMVDFDALIGYAFNTHSSYWGELGPSLDMSLNLYPVDRLRISLGSNYTWYDWRWVPSVYLKEGLDYRLLVIPDSIRLNLGEDFEFFRSQDGAWMYLGNVSFEAAYESGFWKMDNARLSYLLTQRNGGDFRQYVELGMDNRISLPLSFFADASFMMRFSIDGKPGVPLFFRDGFESNSISPNFGYLLQGRIASLLSFAAGYELPSSPTIAEFLILDDITFSAYFDILLDDVSFYFSTGAEIQMRMSLIGLVDLPLRLRLGYDSISDGFVGSLLFSTKF